VEALSESERAYVAASRAASRWRRVSTVIGAGVGLAAITALAYAGWQDQVEKRRVRAETTARRADSLSAIGQSDSARDLYQQAIGLDRSLAAAYFGLGRLYSQLSDFDSAVVRYTDGLRIDTNNARAYYERGSAYVLLDSATRAIEDYSRSIALSQGDADAYFARGVAHVAARETTLAIVDFQQALRMSQDLALQQATRQRLRQLGAETQPQSRIVNRVYLHYSDSLDTSEVQQLLGELRAQGFNVEGVEWRPERTAGDVRYFFDGDSAFAMSVRNAVELVLAKQGLRQRLRLVRLPPSTGRGARRGEVEVWLPPRARLLSTAGPALWAAVK
jgi:tetratricopeptide (TPR) repeat protein